MTFAVGGVFNNAHFEHAGGKLSIFLYKARPAASRWYLSSVGKHGSSAVEKVRFVPRGEVIRICLAWVSKPFKPVHARCQGTVIIRVDGIPAHFLVGIIIHDIPRPKARWVLLCTGCGHGSHSASRTACWFTETLGVLLKSLKPFGSLSKGVRMIQTSTYLNQ